MLNATALAIALCVPWLGAAPMTSVPISRLAGHTWFETASFAGVTDSFGSPDQAGSLPFRRTEMGSGVPVVRRDDGRAEPSGQRLLFFLPGDRSPFRVWSWDANAEVFLGPSWGERLVPGVAPESVEHDAFPALTARGLRDDAALVAALKKPEAWLRREAILALVELRVTQQASPRCRELVPFLDDASAELRAAASFAAGRCRELDALPGLQRNALHPDPGVSSAAQVALRIVTLAPVRKNP